MPVCDRAEAQVACSHRFPNAVDVELQRYTFWYFLLHWFRFDGSRGGSWGVQGPSSGRPAEKVRGVKVITNMSCTMNKNVLIKKSLLNSVIKSESTARFVIFTQAESWLWGCQLKQSRFHCWLLMCAT